jgi:transposase
MAMGRRAKQRQKQSDFWIAHSELPRTAGHPFYDRLNQLLEDRGFDEFVERQCEGFYAEAMGRPSLMPGRYFRLLLIGYFEGIEGERGIAWRAADSLALRRFLELELNEQSPDHSTISRTRRLRRVEIAPHPAAAMRKTMALGVNPTTTPARGRDSSTSIARGRDLRSG